MKGDGVAMRHLHVGGRHPPFRGLCFTQLAFSLGVLNGMYFGENVLLRCALQSCSSIECAQYAQ